MANTILTVSDITREAQRVLHQKLNFIGNVNRQYDKSFAQAGAKIGSDLRIRLPNQYTVRSGATLAAQDTTEQSVTLQVANQKGVDLNFSSLDLTLSLDDFSKRILEPAMAVLAASMEADALSMYKDVYSTVNNAGNPTTFANVLNARKALNDNLAPMDAGRAVLLNTQANVDMVDALKGLFADQSSIAKQYKEGMMGRTAGFDFFENTLLPSHTVGNWAGTPLVNGAGQTGSTLVTDGYTADGQVLKRGDVITLAGVYMVHPETKATTNVLQQFTLTADVTTSGLAASLSISPAIITSGARQNVSASPADNAAISIVGASNTAHGLSLAFHRDAFVFATADLVMPQGVDFAAREVFDGISIRIVRAYDINSDQFPCRLDVLYGYKAVRPQLAARVASN